MLDVGRWHVSTNPAGDPGSRHLGVLAGWSYLHLFPRADEAFDDVMVEGPRRFVDAALADHPHHFHPGDRAAVVGVGARRLLCRAPPADASGPRLEALDDARGDGGVWSRSSPCRLT